MLKSNKSKIAAIILLVTLGFFSAKLFAQDKDALKEKLDNLKGKVEKLTVKVDGKDVVFEGKDAEKLVNRLREPMKSHMIWVGDDDRDGGPEHEFTFSSGDIDKFDLKTDGDTKKIKVEDKDGKKKVTVTTTKDGKEETKVYEGDDAEKFLKDENNGAKLKFISEDDEDTPRGNIMYFNHRRPRRGCCCCCGDDMPMNIRMMHDKGAKKIIIKEFKDDKENKTEEKK